MRLIQTSNFTVAANEYGDADSSKICLLLPGRLDTKDYANFVSHGEFLAALGYFVVAIDMPGTWDSPGSIENYNTSNYIKVVEELIETLGNRQTILLGHSRGGATAMLATKSPYVSAVILVNAAYGSPTPPDATSIIGQYQKTTRDIPPGNVRTLEQKEFLLPLSYFEDGKKYDPLGALLNFAGPRLIIHANKDEFVKLREVKSIFERAKQPKMFVEIDGAHDYRLFPEAVEQVNSAIDDFLSSYF